MVMVTLAVMLTTLTMSCHHTPAYQEPVLAVSIQPQRYLLEQIVGDRYQVVCLLQEGNNPENYEPSMSNMMALERCQAYFMMGHIGFEAALMNKVSANKPDLKVCDTSQGITLIGGHGEDGDPHVWTSVANAKVIVRNMYAGMVELDPEHKDEYTRRHDRLQQHLDSLNKAFRDKLAAGSDTTFIVWHPSLTYFARDYNLHQIAIEQEGKETTPQHIMQVTSQAKKQGAQVFFYQREFDSRIVQSANDDIKARLVEISPMSYEWEQQMTLIVDALSHPIAP